MTAKKKGKKLLLSVTGIALAAALGGLIWFFARGGGDPVHVYPFGYIGMTEFWGDAQESYGPVKADRIQAEFLSGTQTVTEIKVKEGDMVKKGDVLFTFDTTLNTLNLERKRLEMEKIKVQIDAAGERLQETREMVPYAAPEPTEPKEPDLGKELKEPYEISDRVGQDKEIYDGKTKETAIICWLKDGTAITDELLQELFGTAIEYQKITPPQPEPVPEETQENSSASDEPEDTEEEPDPTESQEDEEATYRVPGFFTCNGVSVKEDNMTAGKEGYLISDSYTYQGKTYWLKAARRKGEAEPLKDLMIPAYPQEAGKERDSWEAMWKDGVEVEYVRNVTFAAKQMSEGKLTDFPQDNQLMLEVDRDVFLKISSVIHDLSKEYSVKYTVSPQNGMFAEVSEDNQLYLTGRPEELTAAPVEYTVTARYEFEDNYEQLRAVEEAFTFTVSVVEQPKTKLGEFYAVFKTTEKNFLKGTPIVWQGAKVTAYADGTFDMLPYNALGFQDHTVPVEEEPEIDLPDIDPNAIYTAEQILDMQKQLYAIIKEQTEALKMAESEYAIMERELGDGNVRAEVDGKVVSVLTEEQAKDEYLPLVKVSGGGGYYIEGSVSELEKEKLQLGQEISVTDWNSGGFYTGEVVSIGDFPTDTKNWNGLGNPTVSYYPFVTFVGEDADLQSGSYVSMSYSMNSAEQGIYLERPFVRMEKGNAYIFVRGADNRLEKRRVRLGRVLWGNYYEILSGLSEEECVAFPYGKNVKHGAPTVEGDISILYSY